MLCYRRMTTQHCARSKVPRPYTISRKSVLSPTREFTTREGIMNAVDKIHTSRLHRNVFSTSLLALNVLPTRDEWCFNPKAEPALERVRIFYEDEVAMTYYETVRMTLDECQELWHKAALSIVELGHYRSGSRGQLVMWTYQNYKAAGCFAQEGVEEEYWRERAELLKPDALEESRMRHETGPKTGRVWTWSSPNNYEQKRRRHRVGDWVQLECHQEAPGKPIVCLMKYSPAPPPRTIPRLSAPLAMPTLVRTRAQDRRKKGDKPPGRH